MMQTGVATVYVPLPGPSSPAALMQAIGTPEFASRLSGFLAAVCGADHFAAFELGPEKVRAVDFDPSDDARRYVSVYERRQYWKHDRLMLDAMRWGPRGESRIMVADIERVVDFDMRRALYSTIRDRLIICGKRGTVSYGLSVLYSHEGGRSFQGHAQPLAETADILVTALAKHSESVWLRTAAARSLKTLSVIRVCVRASDLLAGREAEVCARLLYGMSMIGIALDLDIGEESVKTYRRRAYSRLGIGSPRELLLWYFELWGTKGYLAHGTERC